MDQTTGEERNIEDYLFSGYLLNSKSSFEKDQNFAKPIEDEDIFGIGGSEPINKEQDDCDNLVDSIEEQMELGSEMPDLGGKIFEDLSGISPVGSNLDDDLRLSEGPASELSAKPLSELDDIFRDDYSESSQNNLESRITNNENTYHNTNKKKLPPAPPTPAQIKKKLFREKVLEQVKAKGLESKKPAFGLKQNDVIELEIQQTRLVSDQSSKFIFNRLFNKSKKASPEAEKKCWATYKDGLRKKICSQKRKIWDSFQTRIEVYDDEEEIIEPNDEPSKSKPDTSDDEEAHDKVSSDRENSEGEEEEGSEGNFEDLEKEDMGDEERSEGHVEGEEDEDDDEQSENGLDESEKEEMEEGEEEGNAATLESDDND